jgi:hypothetical protein
VAPAGDDVVDRIDLDYEFQLYVTAHTADPRNGADTIYTNRAMANWSFNGSGEVAQSDPYKWTGDPGVAGDFAPQAWTPVCDGLQPPQLGGQLFNDATANQQFIQLP